MLKGLNKKIPLAVGTGLLLSVLLGASLTAIVVMTGLIERWTTQEQPDSLVKPTKQDMRSVVLPLVTLSPEQRVQRLEAIASQDGLTSLTGGGNALDKPRARYLLASDLLAQNQGEAALKWLEGLESNYPLLAAHIALKRAQAYEMMGEDAQAAQAWNDLLNTYGNNSVAAHALYALGQSNAEYWEQAIAEFPNHPSTYEMIRQRLAENPNQPALLLHLVKHFPNAPGMDEVRDRVMAEYNEQLTPEDWEAIAFGYSRTLKKDNFRKAAQAYAQAPRNSRNAYRVARGLLLAGKQAEARAAYQQFVTEFPEAEEMGLALVHLASISESQQALTYLDRVIADFPEQAPEALMNKATILEALGSGQSASQARQSVLTQYPNSQETAQYRWRVAKQKAAQGNLDEAWQWAQPITTDIPDSELAPEAAFWVGRWAAMLQRQQEAQVAFEHVLKRYPESFYAWRSARFLGWDVGDFGSVRQLTPDVVRPQERSELPTGSDTLKELYKLGQDRDAWTLWQVEFENLAAPSVAEQFTDGVMRLGVGQHLAGINQIENLKQRDNPLYRFWHLNQARDSEEQAQLQALQAAPIYWHKLYPFPYLESIVYWSQQRQLNPLLMTALIRQESRFEPDIRSVAGATGLSQVMPGTAEWIAGQTPIEEYDLTNPNDNLQLGTWYLDFTHQEYSNNSLLAVASYNAGPGNVSKWLTQFSISDPDAFIEVIPFAETKGYVEAVFANYWNYLRLYNPEIAQKYSKYGGQSTTKN